MNIIPSALFRSAGVFALLSGLGFILVGLFHPLNIPSEVTSATWINVHIIAVAMCFFGLFGVTGLYIRQIEKFGVLGLLGFTMLVAWMTVVICFSFVEAFILPGLATESPAYVAGLLGMFTGTASEVNLGILPIIWIVSGPLYILGQLFFGIATFRARIFPRYAGGLLALSALLTPLGGLVTPEHQPLVMVPAGLALIWLGYSLWSDRKTG
jgi:hypothetical protein